jgi:hypothetical protein
LILVMPRDFNPGRFGCLLASASGGLAVSLLVGCTAQLPARPIVTSGGNQGGSWETVMAGPRVVRTEMETGAVGVEGWEYARRDEALSYRPPQALLATDAWPERPQPSLDEPYYISIPTQPNVYLYFRTGYSEGSAYRWFHGYHSYGGYAWPGY